MDWSFYSETTNSSDFPNLSPSSFTEFRNLASFNAYSLKPYYIPVALNPSENLFLYQLESNLNSSQIRKPRAFLYQVLEPGIFVFLTSLYEGIHGNRLDLATASPDPGLVVVPLLTQVNSFLNINGLFSGSNSANNPSLNYQVFEWVLSTPVSSFAIPNFSSLNTEDSIVTLNGVEQNDLVDYIFDSGNLVWIGNDPPLNGGDLLKLRAVYQ